MTNYLVTFHPLCSTATGRLAVQRHGLPGFIDGSCRREPDLQAQYPSISSLCRASKFAPRLDNGDRVFYMSVKGRYDGEVGWALVAALKVIHVAQNHREAFDWYLRERLPPPSNCMVPGNRCVPLSRTTGLPRDTEKVWAPWGGKRTVPPSLKAWNKEYARRAKAHPRFVVTEAIVESRIDNPPIETAGTLAAALKTRRVPMTQLYKKLSDEQFDALVKLLAR